MEIVDADDVGWFSRDGIHRLESGGQPAACGVLGFQQVRIGKELTQNVNIHPPSSRLSHEDVDLGDYRPFLIMIRYTDCTER